GLRQPELGDLAADHPSSLRVAVVDDALVTERSQISGNSQRSRPGADERDSLAVFPRRGLGQTMPDVVLEVGGDALQATDRHRFRLEAIAVSVVVRGPLFHAPATARRFTWAVAGPAENAGKDVRLPVDHEGVAITPRRDQPDVFRDWSVGGARPLAI